ncbi:MAG: hypothetical protein ACFCD0_08925 [Gemmataceae bacterium]
MNIEIDRQGQPDLHQSGGKARHQSAVSNALFWLLSFVLFQFVCQLVLVSGYAGGMRKYVRVAAFGASFAMLAFAGKGKLHPASSWILVTIGIMLLNMFHPTTNTFLAATAQIVLYSAIAGPLFWVGRFTITPKVLKAVLMAYWGFHTLSAFVGVLQVYYPGRFQPAIDPNVLNDPHFEKYFILLANGEKVLRPMGLTDAPGMASLAGLYAFVFGLGFFFYFKSWIGRGCGLGSMAIGVFCIYLTQVRSMLVMTGVCTIVFGVLALRRQDMTRFTLLMIVAPVILGGAFLWAVAVGGQETHERFASLTEDSASQVYYKNRGTFLEHTITELIPEFPLGAGLGRWGMMCVYFGDMRNPDSPKLYAEIIWTAWVYDGGVPLVLAFCAALFSVCRTAWQVGTSSLPDELPLWGTLILAYNFSIIAGSFNCCQLASTMGLDFWFLNALLFSAALYVSKKKKLAKQPQHL